ncbi:TetR/AcrR family transcriptional regulator [Amycolatopsis ultiminotia]|uniref:TetR/AcrR family transcriptional regulator n=1 Tax=Amycolatopsis ultiminotia TaxID=543629 RepID=A0ABP6WBE9_9PSEU
MRDLRRATLDATARLLAEQGAGGLSVRKIAAAAECSTISVYHYFEHKQGLLDAVHAEGHRRLREAQSAQQHTADPEADVRNTCLVYREVALSYPDYFRVMFGHPIPGFHRPTGQYRTPARENYASFVQVVRRWGEQVSLVTDAKTAAYGLWSTGHGMVMLELTGNAPREGREKRYTVTIDALMHGLIADA